METTTKTNANKMDEIISFIGKLGKLLSKKDIAFTLLESLNSLLPVKFLSFVERAQNQLKVICQLGDGSSINNIFNKEMSHQIFDWVIKHKQLASLKLGEKEQFLFMPLLDQDGESIIEHGMLVFCLKENVFEFDKNLKTAIDILSKLASLSMTKSQKNEDAEKFSKLQSNIKTELQLTTKLQKSILGDEHNKKISFTVLEDENSSFNGNIWWIGELGADITLVLIAQVLCKGAPSAMLCGYLLGEMNGLKTKAEISLKPKEVLKYLNQQLNSIFKDIGITVNAWYGVFNLEARKVTFANANHPDPYLIGPEQQVSNLVVGNHDKDNALGISLNTMYRETSSYISSGSKLIICTKICWSMQQELETNMIPYGCRKYLRL